MKTPTTAKNYGAEKKCIYIQTLELYSVQRKINIKILRKHLLRSLKLVWEADKLLAFVNLFLQMLQALLPVASLYCIKILIERLTIGNAAFEEIVYVIIAFLAFQFLLALAAQYAAYINTIQQQKLTDHLSQQVLDKAISVDYEYYENPAYHDTLHLAQQQSLYRASVLLTGFNAVLLNGLSLLFLIVFFVSLHSGFALLFICFSLPLAIIKWYYGIATMQQERKLAPMEREAAYLHQTLTGVTYAKEVRVFGYGSFFMEKFNSIRNYIRKEKQQLNQKLTRYSLIAEAIEVMAMAFIFFLLAKQTWSKTISIGVFVIYIQGFQRLQSSSKNFLQSLVQVLQQRVFLQDLFSFFDIPVKATATKSQPFPVLQKGLSVQHISFQYPQTEKEILHDVSLHCAPGQIIAIVGENGSGKSTLVKLLAGLYELQKGNIFFDDIQLSEMGAAAYRNNSIFLFQDYEKYFFTVEENITLGVSKERSAVSVEAAAQLAGASSFITNLSRGYQTRMGRLFDGSEQLSGGQWQKLSLARIFYKDAALIVLDEPTSAIDANAEAALFANIKKHLQNKMVIIITHRLYNVKIADHIYVMHEGSIAEQGHFEFLLQQHGIFRKMYEAQKL